LCTAWVWVSVITWDQRNSKGVSSLYSKQVSTWIIATTSKNNKTTTTFLKNNNCYHNFQDYHNFSQNLQKYQLLPQLLPKVKTTLLQQQQQQQQLLSPLMLYNCLDWSYHAKKSDKTTTTAADFDKVWKLWLLAKCLAFRKEMATLQIFLNGAAPLYLNAVRKDLAKFVWENFKKSTIKKRKEKKSWQISH